jgi:hypothetical protein
MIIAKEVKIMRQWLKKEEADAWGFEWDDINRAAKEMREAVYGTDIDFPKHSQVCFSCAERRDTAHITKYCPYCGKDYSESTRIKRHLASIIDEVYHTWDRETKDEYHRMVKRLRLVSPEFRAMWEQTTNGAALARRYA